jgi:putative CocE/NonD family hydrolase
MTSVQEQGCPEQRPGQPFGRSGSRVTVEVDVPARMRDGTTLRANVYRPHGGGSWPTLLTRTPYDKGDVRQHVWSGVDPVRAALQGFLVVVQDVRGRFASDGTWDSLRHERLDGFDSVQWAASLPGSNGRVGMFGGSYCGCTQLLAAGERPPALGAIAPALTWCDPMDGLYARGGAVELGLALRWALENGHDTLIRDSPPGSELEDRLAAARDEWDALDVSGNWELPIPGFQLLRRTGLPDLGAFRVIESAEVASWADIRQEHAKIEVPSLHTAGWYDIFLQGTLDNYMALAAIRDDAHLIVGPWTHHAFTDPVGARLFGSRAARDGGELLPGYDWRALQLAWFRAQLTSGHEELQLPPALIFTMGTNTWRDASGWPPPARTVARWYLRPTGKLSPLRPGGDGDFSEFVYDPMTPTPALGGHGIMSVGYPEGPIDQAPTEARPDVLTFTSQPLDDDLEIAGRVIVTLYAKSSCPATDWVARLCDVDPDGRSINICDGIVRIADEADTLQRHDIDLWSTSHVLGRGHCLRVHVTSSSFPRWDRNLNTGDQTAVHHQLAHQRIFHGSSAASHIQLPVAQPR